MIRVIFAFALLGIASFCLVVPARFEPQQLLLLLRHEHAAFAELWTSDRAERALASALQVKETARATHEPSAPASTPLDETVQRLLKSPYTRSLEALLVLAAFRAATWIEWLPWLSLIGVALMLDGFLLRNVKSRQFQQHDPEKFAVFGLLATVGGCTLVGSLVFPGEVHPLVAPVALVTICGLVSRAFANFHR